MAWQANGQFPQCCKNGLSCHPDWPACPPVMLPFASPITSAPSHSTAGPDFSILVIAILGILAIAFLLISYYAIVAKCCSCTSWDTLSHRYHNTQHPRTEPWSLNDDGLEESVIQSIPVFKYIEKDGFIEGNGCAICLNEIEEGETLRLLPKCSHAFHLRCIDTWLESHSNCPLCRASIMSPGVENTHFISNEISISSPDLQNNMNAEMAYTDRPGSENAESTTVVVGTSISIDIKEQKDNEIAETPVPKSIKHNRTVSDFAGNMQRSGVNQKKQLREEPLQAMRRSFSMDSSLHRHCIDLHYHDQVEYSTSAAGSSNMIKRSFLFFGNSRGRSNVILPL